MIKKQRGLTMITWVIVLGLVGTQVVMALRIMPVYMQFGTVKTVMDGLTTDSDAIGVTPKRLKSLISKRLQINSIYTFNDADKKKAFQFKKTTTGTQVTVNYEDRGPIYGNLEFVASFSYEVVVPKQ